MSSLFGSPTIKLWTCCKCKESQIPMTTGDCTRDYHPRCRNCEVRTHAAATPSLEDRTNQAHSSKPATNQSRKEPPSKSPELKYLNEPSSEPIASDVSCVTNSPIPIIKSPRVLIKIVDSDDPIYILKIPFDAALIELWHKLLPELSFACSVACPTLVSIHLFRMGLNEDRSIPTVIVNLSKSTPHLLKMKVHATISRCLDNSNMDVQPIQMTFKRSLLRRSVVSEEPPICEPRNLGVHSCPVTGDSIGIAGSLKDTATLGCYLMGNTGPYVLTVDHLIPTDGLRTDSQITHISEQDREYLIISLLAAEAHRLLNLRPYICQDYCPECSCFQNERFHDGDLWKLLVSVLSKHSLHPCALHRGLQQKLFSDELTLYQSTVLGSASSRSTRRYRTCDGMAREMDWALFRVSDPHPSNLKETLTRTHNSLVSSQDSLSIAHCIKAGALVKSLGRTSGYGLGQISSTLSIIFHEHYTTHEWCILNRPGEDSHSWVEGGIGVDGDSGALIIDEHDDSIYGMLWGRSGEGAATVTLFTPIKEILSDIVERSGMQFILAKGQQISNPQLSKSIPGFNLPTAPILLHSGFEDRGQASLQQEMYSVQTNAKRQPLNAPMRQHPFPRYQTTEHHTSLQIFASKRNQNFKHCSAYSLPPSDPQLTLYPGSYTFLRYVLGDDSE